MLLAGYKTRISTIVTWILLLSLQNANPLLLNSGDVYLRLLLFWAIFLPWGARYSVDAWQVSPNKIPSIAGGWPAIAFIVQICLLYLFTGLYKYSPEWIPEGTSVQYALSLKQMAKPLAGKLLAFPFLLKLLSYTTIFLELAATVLILSPVKNHLTRSVAVASLILFHLGIHATMMVGLFSFVSIAALIGLLPIYAFESRSSVLDDTRSVSGPSLTLRNSGIILLIFTVIGWNLHGWLTTSAGSMPRPISAAVHMIGLNQKWSMFAPAVLKSDGWFVFLAEYENGKQADLFHPDGRIVEESLENWLPLFHNYARWRKYLRNMYRKQDCRLYEAMIQALVHRFDDSLPETVEIIYYSDYGNVGYPGIVESSSIYRTEISVKENLSSTGIKKAP